MIAIPLIRKIGELFLILFATAGLVRVKLLKSEDSKILSRLSLYFVTPCVIFNAFQQEVTADTQQGLLLAMLLAVSFQAVFFLVTAILKRAWKATEVERASIAFTNVGNLIIPIVSYILGPEWVIYASGYILVFNVLFWTLGVRMFDGGGAWNLRKVLLNPNILAVLLGALCLALGIRLPDVLAIAFDDVAGMIGPLSMMITGMVLGGMKLREVFQNRRIWLVIFFRMVLCSGLAALAAALSGVAGFMASGKSIVLIALLAALAPSASNINQVSILYHKDEKYASAINILTTLSCILTMPLWVMVYEALVP